MFKADRHIAQISRMSKFKQYENFSIGINEEYQKSWNVNAQYTVYCDAEETQPLSDRDFFSLSVQRTF